MQMCWFGAEIRPTLASAGGSEKEIREATLVGRQRQMSQRTSKKGSWEWEKEKEEEEYGSVGQGRKKKSYFRDCTSARQLSR